MKKIPLITGDDFISFLYWLDTEKGYHTTHDIIPVVEKPWKWQKEYEEYLEERDEDIYYKKEDFDVDVDEDGPFIVVAEEYNNDKIKKRLEEEE